MGAGEKAGVAMHCDVGLFELCNPQLLSSQVLEVGQLSM